jgi:hypothetical protein
MADRPRNHRGTVVKRKGTLICSICYATFQKCKVEMKRKYVKIAGK